MEISILPNAKLSNMSDEGENVRVRFTGTGGQINDFIVKGDSPVLEQLKIRKRYDIVVREVEEK